MTPLILSLLLLLLLSSNINSTPATYSKYNPRHPNYPPTQGPSPNQIGVFWQISDPHVDLEYAVGSDSVCDVPLCCRRRDNGTAAGNHHQVKVEKKSHQANNNKASVNPESYKALPFGTMDAQCDIPRSTWKLTLQFIESTFSSPSVPSASSTSSNSPSTPPSTPPSTTTTQPQIPDFIIYSGDNIQHAVWQQTPQEFIQYSKMASDDLLEVFGKYQIPVYPTIGNHDGSDAVNELPFKGEKKEKYLQSLDDTWGSNWLRTKEAREDLRQWGYYSERIPINDAQQPLRIINMNSQWVNPLNFWVYSSKDDLSQSLQWLEKQLQTARKEGERVLISTHIPPGISRGSAKPESLNFWNHGMEKLMVEYSDLVIGSVCGHTHEDDFGIFHDYSVSPPRPTAVAFTAPSVTPYHGNHYPSVRKFYYDRSNGALLDQETYYHNLTAFHQDGGTEEDFNKYWHLEYASSEAYGMKNLSPQQVQDKMYAPLWENRPDAWQRFNQYFYVSYDGRQVCKDDDVSCKKKHLCSMGHMDFENYMECVLGKWP